jgi:hypothetical protein
MANNDCEDTRMRKFRQNVRRRIDFRGHSLSNLDEQSSNREHACVEGAMRVAHWSIERYHCVTQIVAIWARLALRIW